MQPCDACARSPHHRSWPSHAAAPFSSACCLRLVGWMHAHDELTNQVLHIIAACKSVNAATLSQDATLAELRVDSLDGLSIFLDIEERFDITIPDDTARLTMTVREIIAHVEALVAAKGTATITPNSNESSVC